MKKINIYIFLFSVFSSILGSNNLFADGIGIYLPTTSYFGTGSISSIGYNDQYSGDVNATHLGIGIFYDSQISASRDFNYKVALVYEIVTDKSKYNYIPPFIMSTHDENKFNRYSTDFIFGFRMIESSKMRLWLGPNIRFSYMSKSQPANYDEWRLGVGVGLIAGCNFHILKRISLNMEIGGRANLDAGEKDYQFLNETGNQVGITTEDVFLKYAELILNFGIIFQLNNE